MSHRKLPPLSPRPEDGETDPGHSDTAQRKKKRIPRTKTPNTDTINGPSSAEVHKRPRSRSNSTRRRQQEPEPDSNIEENAQPNTRRKKKTKAFGTSRETLMGDESDATTTKSPVRKKKRKKKAAEQIDDMTGLAADLSTLQDDVVRAEEESDQVEPTPVMQHKSVMKSQNTNTVYIEQKGGFKSADKDKLARMQAEEYRRTMAQQQTLKPVAKDSMQFALSTNNIFRRFGLFCHGLLAGFALWQVIMVYSLSDHSGGYTDFLVYYAPVSMPVQALYYLLLAICTMSVFDRYDVGSPTQQFIVRALTLQNGGVSVLFYFVCLVVSISLIPTDDRIKLSQLDNANQDQLWGDNRDSELNRWVILNVLRCVLAILGWLVISITPNSDRLTKNLSHDDLLSTAFKNPVKAQLEFESVRSSGV